MYCNCFLLLRFFKQPNFWILPCKFAIWMDIFPLRRLCEKNFLQISHWDGSFSSWTDWIFQCSFDLWFFENMILDLTFFHNGFRVQAAISSKNSIANVTLECPFIFLQQVSSGPPLLSKLAPQTEQLNGFFPSWTEAMCLFIYCTWNGFIPSWTVATCIFKFPAKVDGAGRSKYGSCNKWVGANTGQKSRSKNF